MTISNWLCSPGIWALALLLRPVAAFQLSCDLLRDLQIQEDLCTEALAAENASTNHWAEGGCAGIWDRISCWPSSAFGETVTIPCPKFLQGLTDQQGSLYRNCTKDGWSMRFPSVDVACGYDANITEPDNVVYFMHLKTLYTTGYGTSLASLVLALALLASFRRLRCTRNYIHMHLFASFILRAMSIFIKDEVLYSTEDIDHCNAYSYCIMANYSWLLVEGLYLHTLLVISFFSEWKYFCWYIALGWGSPLAFIIAWTVCRHLYENIGCWDINSNASIWWIIRGPVILSIFINFILFVRIIRILMKKLKTMDVVSRNDLGQYKRLARSTLLLIPLFGIHYMVFAFFPEDVSSDTIKIRLSFELTLGSFQGFLVAVLYCFLNREVQSEIHRKWCRCHFREYFLLRQQNNSMVSSAPTILTQVMPDSQSSNEKQRKKSAEKSSAI
ncbi:secretin receptor isoform X2 [Xenopus laevis]|uniref:Secretin receptor isoform X2 n=1 Tax=Xenopus laevis TaxID=8355 RepID=A0A8J1LZ43_XENLA|nr:secretin receptor isoform X2 [Xenopus laevis]